MTTPTPPPDQGGVGDAVSDAASSVGNWVSSGVGDVVGQLVQLPQQVLGFLTALEKPVQALMWWANPVNWARIIAGVLGFVLLGAGLLTLGLAA